MVDVFLSYASSDRALATAIARVLTKQRWQVFWDRSIPVGRKWQDVLQLSLQHARCVVVLLTRESLKSSWVSYEASVALQRRILIPILLDSELNPYTDLPEMYRDLHIVSLPRDEHQLLQASANDLWVKTISANVKRRRLIRGVRLSAVAAALLLFLLVSIYVAVTSHNAIISWQAGVRYIERGTYSKEENERLKGLIRSATLIEMLVPNAVSFTSAFRDDLPVFLRNETSRMRVILADPSNEFYDAMMGMTTEGIEKDAKASAVDKGLPDRSRRLLLSFSKDAERKVEFHKFKTEFRLPVILIDRKYCLTSVRLTPDQSTQSVRIELADDSAGSPLQQMMARVLRSLAYFLIPSNQREENFESCARHFDSVWARSSRFE